MPRGRRKPDGPHGQFLRALRDGVEACGLTSAERLLVAFSGGPDSTALLIAMHELSVEPGSNSPRIEAAHFNHQLRGEESVADEKYCRRLCRQLGVQLHVDTGEARAHATANGISVETAARDLRYAAFARLISEQGFSGVATAHTVDDQAETILLAVTRGSGLRGLSGMGPVTERRDIHVSPGSKPLTVFRPMLAAGISGAQTAAFCESAGISPRIDPSNTDQNFARNRIRHSVMPELRKINPAVTESLVTLAANAASAHELLQNFAKAALERAKTEPQGGLSKAILRQAEEKLLPYILMEAFEQATGTLEGLEKTHIDAMCGLVESGLETQLPRGWRMVADQDSARIIHGDNDPVCPYPETVGEIRMTIPGTVSLGDGYSLSAKIVSPVPDFSTLTGWQAVVSIGSTSPELTIRSRREGDRFQPLGMSGEMKLQDFFVNEHVPWWWRDRVPLVVASGRIAWVTGVRVAEWAKVPSDAESAVILEFTHDA